MPAVGCTCALVTGRGKRAIEDHFDISYELEQQIKGTSKDHLLTEIRDALIGDVYRLRTAAGEVAFLKLTQAAAGLSDAVLADLPDRQRAAGLGDAAAA